MCLTAMFRNTACLTAKYTDSSIPDTADEWPGEFSVFSISQVETIALWGVHPETRSEAEKLHAIDRQMARPIFLLCFVQSGSRHAHGMACQ